MQYHCGYDLFAAHILCIWQNRTRLSFEEDNNHFKNRDSEEYHMVSISLPEPQSGSEGRVRTAGTVGCTDGIGTIQLKY